MISLSASSAFHFALTFFRSFFFRCLLLFSAVYFFSRFTTPLIRLTPCGSAAALCAAALFHSASRPLPLRRLMPLMALHFAEVSWLSPFRKHFFAFSPPFQLHADVSAAISPPCRFRFAPLRRATPVDAAMRRRCQSRRRLPPPPPFRRFMFSCHAIFAAAADMLIYEPPAY